MSVTLTLEEMRRLRDVLNRYEAAWQARPQGGAEPALGPLIPADFPPGLLGPLEQEGEVLAAEYRGAYEYAPDNKSKFGPVSLVELRELARRWELWPEDMVHRLGDSRWIPAHVSDDLKGAFVVGDHQVVAPLGHGGWGAVFRAWDPQLERHVALKMVRRSVAGPTASGLFSHEARAVARLRHAHIIPILQLGEHQGNPYFTMDLADGGTLAKHLSYFRLPALTPRPSGPTTPPPSSAAARALRRTLALARSAAGPARALARRALPPLDPLPGCDAEGKEWSAAAIRQRADRIAGLMSDLAEALHHAHQQGIIHRDLKPLNILFQTQRHDGPDGDQAAPEGEPRRPTAVPVDLVPKVADFGLALRLHQAGSSLAGGVVGTPSYMAPEQAEDSPNVGVPADVHGLGAILYELLTGRPPFDGATIDKILEQARAGNPPSPHALNPTVPRDLEAICVKCLRKEPGDRYDSARGLSEDLRRYRANEPIKARPVGAVQRLRLWKRRSPWAARAVAASAGLLAVVFVLGVVLLVVSARKQAAEEEARLRQLENQLAGGRSELHQLRQMRQGPVRADAWVRVEGHGKRLAELRAEFEAGVRGAGAAGRLTGRLQAMPWDELTQEGRDEVTAWLTTVRLGRGDVWPLPADLDPEVLPNVAVRSEVGATAEVAALTPGGREICLLSAGGHERRRLDVPLGLVKRARITVTEARSSLNARQVNQNTHFAASRLSYTKPGRLEYQVGDLLAAWDLTTDKKGPVEERWVGVPPQPHGARENAASDRFIAALDKGRVTVTVQGVEAGARPVVVWRAAGGDPAAGGEGVVRIAFEPGGRALFVLSNTRLAVVDAETGLTAEAALGDASRFERDMVPCAGGVALVERPGEDEAPGPARVAFWQAALPEGHPRALRHDAPARAVCAGGPEGDGLVVVGTADHLVRAWRGGARAWEVGIPYLGHAEAGLRPGSADSPGGSTLTRRTRQSGPAGSPRARRYLTAERGPAPQPYSSWTFLPGDGTRLFVQRPDRPPDGPPTLATEVYVVDAPEGEGKAQVRRGWTYPADGPGCLVATDEHGRRGVCAQAGNGGLGVLQLVSLADGGPVKPATLGPYLVRDGKRRVPPRVQFVTGPTASDYLLIGRPRPAGAGGDLEIWSAGGAGPTRVGRVSQPAVFAAAFLIDGARAVVWRTRLAGEGPYFAQVIDLAGGKVVCDLPEFKTTGVIYQSLMSADHFVYACHQGLGDEANDPYRVFDWNLTDGERRPLGDVAWASGDPPNLEFSPDRRHVAVYGNLHGTGEAQVQIYDLARAALVGQPRRAPWPARPWLSRVAEAYCAVELVNSPAEGQSSFVNISWETGGEAGEARGPEIVTAQRFYSGATGWLLWGGAGGLTVQDGYGGLQKTRLAESGDLARDPEWLFRSGEDVVWPRPGGGAIALPGPHGGVWDVTTGKKVVSLDAGQRLLGLDEERRWALTFAPDTRQVTVWDLRSGARAHDCRPEGPTDPPFDPARGAWRISPDGRYLVVLSRGVLRLWDLDAGASVFTFPKPGHSAPVTAVAQHAEAGLVVSGDEDGLVLQRARADGRLLLTFRAHPDPVTALAFRPDGAAFASASAAGDVSLWGRDGKRAWSSRVDPQARVTQIAFDPGGDSLYAATADGRVIPFAADGGKQRPSLEGAGGPVRALAVSADGQAIAAGTETGARVWRGRERELRAWDTGAPVTAVAFVGGLLATGGQQVQLWDVEAARPVWALPVPHGPVRALAPDAATGELVVVDQGADVIVFDLPALHARLDALGLAVPNFPHGKGTGRQ